MSDITTHGGRGERPGRYAAVGDPPPADRRSRRKGKGEQLMVPEATPRSYYGMPILNGPTWEARDIAGYLFLGGLAGASSAVAAGAQATGRPGLARGLKLTSAGAAGLSIAALVHDLGRPARFVNMLRVFKPTSPMSVGSWLLAGFVPASLGAAGSEVTGWLPGIGTVATAGAAVLGPAVASYTAALISDTAVPAWHEPHREMPLLFVSSAAAAAAGAGLALAPVAEQTPVRRLAVVAAVTETAAAHRVEGAAGRARESYSEGRAGTLSKVAEVLTVAGGLGAAVLARRTRVAAVLSGAALLAGSACRRFSVFYAGVASADDPAHVVDAQRGDRADAD